MGACQVSIQRIAQHLRAPRFVQQGAEGEQVLADMPEVIQGVTCAGRFQKVRCHPVVRQPSARGDPIAECTGKAANDEIWALCIQHFAGRVFGRDDRHVEVLAVALRTAVVIQVRNTHQRRPCIQR